MRFWPVIAVALLAASGAAAQQAGKSQGLPNMGLQNSGAKSANTAKAGNSTSPGAQSTMADLVSRGYEIKAAVPNGGKYIVFMQKDQSAYACEFSSLTDTRCGSLN